MCKLLCDLRWKWWLFPQMIEAEITERFYVFSPYMGKSKPDILIRLCLYDKNLVFLYDELIWLIIVCFVCMYMIIMSPDDRSWNYWALFHVWSLFRWKSKPNILYKHIDLLLRDNHPCKWKNSRRQCEAISGSRTRWLRELLKFWNINFSSCFQL